MYSKCSCMGDARQVFESLRQPNVVTWTALILGYADNGEGTAALDMFSRMKLQGCAPDSVAFVAVLKACTKLALEQGGGRRAECLRRGKQIHLEIGSHLNTKIQSTLIEMYAKCGSMNDAHEVFAAMKCPDVVSWTVLILGYAENGKGATALDVFAKMKCQGCAPDSITYIAALKACASLALELDGKKRAECLELGKQIESDVGYHSISRVQNTLIDMYAKCGSMVNARRVFDSMKNRSVVSWTALILGYADNGEGATALHLFSRMRCEGCVPNSVTYIGALKACISLALEQEETGRAECLKHGKQIHSELLGCHFDTYLQCTLIDMYVKCGSLGDARQVFDSTRHPTVALWTALIMGYVEHGDGDTALDLFAKMKSRGNAPDCRTFVAALKACILRGALESGRKIHAEINAATEPDVVLVTCLVDLYAKCGSLAEARNVFDSHPRTRNLKVWNAMLAGYSRSGDENAAFGLFERMQDAGVRPDGVTFLCLLTCCSHAGLVEKANTFFETMSRTQGIRPTVEHFNCMVDLLGRSNKLEDAVSMLRSMPCKPTPWTWMIILGACHNLRNVGIGRLAFMSLDDESATSFVLLGHIYGSKGMWEQRKMIPAV